MNHETSKKLFEVETDNHIWIIEKVYYFDFQETDFIVMDVLGDYCESFESEQQAIEDFNKRIKED